MRKLKKFTLAEGHELSAEEMAMLEGGDFIPFSCNYEHAACVVLGDAGVYTGTCQYVGLNGETVLACVKN